MDKLKNKIKKIANVFKRKPINHSLGIRTCSSYDEPADFGEASQLEHPIHSGRCMYIDQEISGIEPCPNYDNIDNIKELLKFLKAKHVNSFYNTRYAYDILDHNRVLHQTIIMNAPNLVKLLLINGADPNLQNGIGNTPLHIAFDKKKPELALLLLRHGADWNIKNEKEETAPSIGLKKTNIGTLYVAKLCLKIDLVREMHKEEGLWWLSKDRLPTDVFKIILGYIWV